MVALEDKGFLAVMCFPCLLWVLQVLLTVKAVDGYYGQQYLQCFYSQDLNTVEFIYSWYFNKAEYVRYNSTTDKYTGFTNGGMAEAETLNRDPSNSLSFLLGEICIDNRDRYYNNFLKTVMPGVTVRLLRADSEVLPAMLMCRVYDYYPKGASVSWLRDGQVLREGVSSTGELSNGDWMYQIHSYLEYTPTPGENISCMVKHKNFTQPIIHTWDPSLPADQRNKLIVGIFLLVLGIILAAAGFFYYMLSSKECPAGDTSQSISLERTVSEASSEASEASNL